MHNHIMALLFGGVFAVALAVPKAAQAQLPDPEGHHGMWQADIAEGWQITGMAHVYPALTFGAPSTSGSPLRRTDLDFPHAAAMANVSSPGSRFVLRLMPNLEGVTLSEGEIAFGTWGEGFIDSRHPHTLLHEAMLSLNVWDAPRGALSLSLGRGFAPYGTADPMYRPALKYPTNHHIAQILERWTASFAYALDSGWRFEAGIFDGAEPDGPWDMGNIRNFPNSWSGRISRTFGALDSVAPAPWELSVSYGRIREQAEDSPSEERTNLFNAAVRHSAVHDFGALYSLLSVSRSDPHARDGYISVLAEAQLGLGRVRPFARLEYATRPEYERDGAQGRSFFRYEHHEPPVGATRWLIGSAGIDLALTALPVSVRPFAEASRHRVSHERGLTSGPDSLLPDDLFGAGEFWTVSVGVRLFLGGGPMQMGRYGVLDPVTAMPHGGDDPMRNHH